MKNDKAEEEPYELKVGASLVHNKYKVIGKIGTGSFASVHSISMNKGGKQVVRAMKVVNS